MTAGRTAGCTVMLLDAIGSTTGRTLLDMVQSVQGESLPKTGDERDAAWQRALERHVRAKAAHDDAAAARTRFLSRTMWPAGQPTHNLGARARAGDLFCVCLV